MPEIKDDQRSPYLQAAMPTTKAKVSTDELVKLKSDVDRMARNAFSETNEEMRGFTAAINYR